NCVIEQNSSYQGGGILIENTSPYIENCIIAANSATEGAGIYMSYGAGGTFVNCLIAQNQALSAGGACYAHYQTESTFTNCTIEGNTAPSGNEGFYFNTIWYHLLNMSNSIVWNHGTAFQSNDFTNTTINIDHSIIQGSSVYPGIGNMNANPQFINAMNGRGTDAIWGTADDGLSLTACSPAINASNTITQPVNDITSFPRNGIFDIGAYEFQEQGLIIPTIPGIYKATAIVATGSRLDYINCANNYLILSLDTTGSGAVIPADSVSVKVGVGATFYPSGTGFVQQVPGEVYFNREWDVRALQQPTTGNVDVFMYYTMNDFTSVQDTAQQHGMVGPSVETELDFYKVKTPGLPAFPAISSLQTSDIIRIFNGAQPDTNAWVAGNLSNHDYAHFRVSSFSGGGGGLMHKLFPLPIAQLSLQGYGQQGTAHLTYNLSISGELNTLELEESQDGNHFTVAENLRPSWKVNQDTYSIELALPFQSTYFRIKATHSDGQLLYSPAVLIQDKGDKYIELYPNPTAGILHIKSFVNKAYEVTIRDIYGKVCLTRELHSSIETLDLGGLSKGFYQVQVKQGKQVTHYKLQLQ
ncbi:MAG TPA: T9SS type A sorting domain-containing protein, partial [Chitinophagaceae bacterium]|nr:T9SS type A sorting domain-containing protein [Chitinophagaceae bacterium]